MFYRIHTNLARALRAYIAVNPEIQCNPSSCSIVCFADLVYARVWCLLSTSIITTDFVHAASFRWTFCADTGRRSSSTDSRLKTGCDVDVTSRGTPHDFATMSSQTSSSMPHLGPSDRPDTIQPLNHIYLSSSAALTGRHGDDEEAVAVATKTRWTGRQGRHRVRASRDCTVEQCYWSGLSAGSNSGRHAFDLHFC